MDNDLSPASLFNPLVAWTDLGLRAAEMTMASSQNFSDAFDRMTRARASEQPSGSSAGSVAPRTVALPVALPAALGQFGNLQRTLFELATENWIRWVSAVGTMASLPGAVGLARPVAGQNNPLEAMRTSLRLAAWEEKPAAERQVGSPSFPTQRKQRDAASDMQHALASESKPRRKPAAKRKGAPRGTRKSA